MNPRRKRVRPAKSHRGPDLTVQPLPSWQFQGEPAPVAALRLAIGGSWTAITPGEAVALADALIDTVEDLEDNS